MTPTPDDDLDPDLHLIACAALTAFIEYRHAHGEWPPVEDEAVKREAYRLYEAERAMERDNNNPTGRNGDAE